jgi:hypothetical protein
VPAEDFSFREGFSKAAARGVTEALARIAALIGMEGAHAQAAPPQ